MSAPRPRVLPLAPAFTPDGGFLLALSLRAWLLVEPTLPKLRIKSGALDFPLELAKGPLEVVAFLNDYFQDNHSP